MHYVRRTLLVVIPVVLVAVIAGYWWQRPMLLTGTGYAAHNACAVSSISGRTDVEDDLPDNPLVPFLRTSGDQGDAEASLVAGLANQKAWYNSDFGCTLADERPAFGTPTAVDSAKNPYSSGPEPTTGLHTPTGKALADAFNDVPGTRGIVAIKDGEVVVERYADDFDADMPQLGWSMSKSATSLMLGMLVKQGEVTLREDGLLPEWTDERADITIANLIRMTSGLMWDEEYELGTPITTMLYRESDMGAYVADQDAAHNPGAVQQYSSGSTTLLCDILADRTGLGADLPRRVLFEPLGLSSAVMEPDATGTPVCSSYMWATPRDWAALGQFALQNGEWNGQQLLPRGWMKRSLTVKDVASTDDPGYGMGWRTNEMPDDSLRWPDLPPDAYSANGHDGQEMIIVPSEELVVVRLGFSPDVDDTGAPALAATLTEQQ